MGLGESQNASGSGGLCSRAGTFSRSEAIVSRVIAGETIVVPIRGGAGDLESIYTFNDLGTRLWEMLGEGHSAGAMADWVTRHYEVDADTAFADVQKFLARLEQEGLASPLK